MQTAVSSAKVQNLLSAQSEEAVHSAKLQKKVNLRYLENVNPQNVIYKMSYKINIDIIIQSILCLPAKEVLGK